MINVEAKETIRQLASKIRAPLNILAHYSSPSIAELEELGVAHLSFGSIPMRATLALLHEIATGLRQQGT